MSSFGIACNEKQGSKQVLLDPVVIHDTIAARLLGEFLFFDPVLSSDSSISCSSCHKPEFAFADNVPVSKGVTNELGTRNAPSLLNVGARKKLHWEGGFNTLELQLLSPIRNETEMNSSLTDLDLRLSTIRKYQTLSQKAFKDSLTLRTLAIALATFERSLTSYNSAYDTTEMKSEIPGYNLAQEHCFECHSPPTFFKDSFANILGKDNGLYNLTYNESDKGKFRVPTLRNMAHTPPYFHDGSSWDLDDVIEKHSLGLTTEQKDSILIFLNHLNSKGIQDTISINYP